MSEEFRKSSRRKLGEDDLAYIGYGYNLIQDSLFDKKNLKSRIFKPDEVLFDVSATDDDEVIFASKSTDEISKSINASVGVDVSGFAPFSLDVKAKFNSNTTSTDKSGFAYLYHSYHKGIETFENCSIPFIVDKCLDPYFKQAVNDPCVSPADLIKSYGTHAIASGVQHGARFNCYITYSDVSDISSEDFNASLTAKILKFKASGSTTLTDKEKHLMDTVSYRIYQTGGHLGEAIRESDISKIYDTIDKWLSSLSGEGMGEGITSVGTLYGIWEFASNVERQNEIKNFILYNNEAIRPAVDFWSGMACDLVGKKMCGLGFVRNKEIPSGLTLNQDRFVNKIKEKFMGSYPEYNNPLTKVIIIDKMLRDEVTKLNDGSMPPFEGGSFDGYSIFMVMIPEWMPHWLPGRRYTEIYFTDNEWTECLTKKHHIGEPGTW